jgi:hypothetical protein
MNQSLLRQVTAEWDAKARIHREAARYWEITMQTTMGDEQKKKPCPLGGRCICLVDRDWNHEHFGAYTHCVKPNHSNAPILAMQGTSAGRDAERILSKV